MTSPLLKRFRAPCLLALLLIVAFYDVTLLGKTFKATTANSQALPTGAYGQEHNKPKFIPVNGTDAPVLEEPILAFIKNNLRRGILPLWNPHQAGGFSLIGMIEIGIFFPLHLIMFFLPSLYAWDVLILCRLFLAGLLTYLFMRSLGFKETPSLAAGISFMLSGPMLLLQYWTANVDILLPLLLMALDRLILKPSSRTIAFAAVSVGLTIFAGHPEHILLVNLYALFFFLFRLITLRPSAPARNFTALISAYILGASLAAVVLFPFLREFLTEFWHGHPAGTGMLMEEQRDRALTLALPHFFQKENLTYQWSFAGWWGGYLGILPLGLAFLGLWSPEKKRLNYFFAAMLIAIVGKEYGLPFIAWIGRLPLLDLPRYAIHTPALAAFSAAVLAGMGIRHIIRARHLFLKGLLFSLTLAGITAWHLIKADGADYFPLALKASVFALSILVFWQGLLLARDRRWISRPLTAALMAALLFSELFLYIHRERPVRFDSFPEVPYITWLRNRPAPERSYGQFWAFYPNTATGFSVDDLGYFFGLVPKRFVHFVNTLLLKDYFKSDLRPPAVRAIPIQGREELLDLLNVRYLITPASDDYARRFRHFESADQRFPLVYSGEVKIFERPGAFPRAFVVHKAVFESDGDKVLSMIQQLQGQLRHIAVLQGPRWPAVAEALRKAPLQDGSQARIRETTPNRVVIDVRMEHPGVVILSDAYHPDWKATVNGRAWKIFPADYLLRGVYLPEGTHRVVFTFSPWSFRLGGIISLLSLLSIILLSLWSQHPPTSAPHKKKEPSLDGSVPETQS